MAPEPFCPLKFSGLIERVLASESKDKVPIFIFSPSNAEADCATIIIAARENITILSIFFIKFSY